MEEMRIGEREENVNCQPAAGGQQQPPFANQHLGGTPIDGGQQQQQQLASLAGGGFPYHQQAGNSSESRNLHYPGSQDSLGQGSQAEIGRDGEQAALARREGIKKRSKSLKCNKVNLFPLLHWSPIQSYLKTHNCLNLC